MTPVPHECLPRGDYIVNILACSGTGRRTTLSTPRRVSADIAIEIDFYQSTLIRIMLELREGNDVHRIAHT